MLSGLNHVKTRAFHIYSLLMKYDNFFDRLHMDHTYEHINSIFSTYNVDSVDKSVGTFYSTSGFILLISTFMVSSIDISFGRSSFILLILWITVA